ncbi:MAG: energy transducer TonB [Bacteroidota bacterium]|nr:energy transducer TonB [Bacteroidota bacterium]
MKRTFFCILIMMFVLYGRSQSRPVLDSITRMSRPDHRDTIEIESSFPGGDKGWANFLSNTLVYPPKAIKKKIEGQVVAQFIIEKDGTLSDIEIISGPKELWPPVMDVLKQSPNWKPAVQNGKKVKSYKKQPFNFRLETK